VATEPLNRVSRRGFLRFMSGRLLLIVNRESMKQLVEPESIRVQMFLRFSECKLMNRAEGEWKNAALRLTCLSRAELLKEDVLGKAGASADDAVSFLKAQLWKQSPHSVLLHP